MHQLPLSADRARVRIAAVTAVVCAAATLVAPSAFAASKTTKTTAKSKVSASKSVATVKSTTTTLPKPISAGTPLKGWEQIADTEWPAAGDAVIASANAKSVEIFRVPGDRAGVLRFDNGRSVYGSLHLLALGSRGDYVRVAVPIRPNGTVGWVRRSDVTLSRTALRIVIELATNTLTLTDGEATVLQVPVAAGTGGTPTPTGLFYLKELVPQANANGALGPYAFGLSGFSTVLMTFAGGQGVIGIHGTNAPGKLGGDVSHGCVRVDNTTIRKLAGMLELGTPVEIVNKVDQLPPKGFRVHSEWMEKSAVEARSTSVTTTTTVGDGSNVSLSTTTSVPGGLTGADSTTTLPGVTTTSAVTTTVPAGSPVSLLTASTTIP